MIVGPRQRVGQEAKRQVVGSVGIDGLAGPSELVVVATAGADAELVALDLLAQAEHGEDSPLWLISPGSRAARGGRRPRSSGWRPSARASADAELEAGRPSTLGGALALAEQIAPEHLELVGADAEALAGAGARAGCVFVGAGAGTAFGDYVAGSNHVLPTGGAARFQSALSPATFRRRMARVSLPGEARGPPRPRRRRAGPRRGLPRARRVDGAPSVSRTAHIHRVTGETDVSLSLGLDGTGAGERATGVGFFDHLLDALARHGGLDLDVGVRGDLETGPHHTVEDTGIALGQALDEALGDRAGIARFGHAVVPMDEARAACAIDISGRPFTAFEGDFAAERVADFDTDLVEEFLRARGQRAPS